MPSDGISRRMPLDVAGTRPPGQSGYVPPFGAILRQLKIEPGKGGGRISVRYDDFLTVVKMMLRHLFNIKYVMVLKTAYFSINI